MVYLCRTKITRVYLDNRVSDSQSRGKSRGKGTNNALSIGTFAFPFYINTCVSECSFYKLSHRMAFACADHVIIRFILLKYKPHHLNILRGKTPVPLCFEVDEI